MSQGLRISRLIARFYLESEFSVGKYSSKPSLMSLIWFLVMFTYSANS